MIQPGGPRYKIDEAEQFVAWMGFELYFTTRAMNAMALYDIKFNRERIMYELGLQEALAAYSVANPMQSGQNWLDTYLEHNSRGSTCRECSRTTSFIWWDNGTLCNICYSAANQAKHNAAGYTCRKCATTTIAMWYDLTNPAGKLCRACYNEATTAKHQDAGYTCRECDKTTTILWHDPDQSSW